MEVVIFGKQWIDRIFRIFLLLNFLVDLAYKDVLLSWIKYRYKLIKIVCI